LSALAAAGDRDAVRRLTAQATRAVLPVAVLAVVVSVPAMRPALGAVYGKQYEPAAVLAILLMVASALRVLVIWSKVLPVAIGRPGLRVGSVAAESITVMAGAYLIPRLLPQVDVASLRLGWVIVAVATGLLVFWAWMSRRPNLLPSG
jgi:O-antigen/teichoic acid export membrane protein